MLVGLHLEYYIQSRAPKFQTGTENWKSFGGVHHDSLALEAYNQWNKIETVGLA